jgi:hypothetical protein
MPAKATKVRKPEPKKRFEAGAEVFVGWSRFVGIVTQVDDEPSVLWEYWHTVRIGDEESRHAGCELELTPKPQTNIQKPMPSPSQTNHFYGDNARVNNNSTDNSTNAVTTESLFVQMRERAAAIADDRERADIIELISELEQTKGSTEFLGKYQRFIATAANHMTLFTPFIPLLTKLLGGQG